MDEFKFYDAFKTGIGHTKSSKKQKWLSHNVHSEELLFFYCFNPWIPKVFLKREQDQRDRNVPGIQTLLTQTQNYSWHSLAPL